jgi:DNA polymerase-4
MPALCRDCLHTFDDGGRCAACRSPRLVAHPELLDLTIAHLDCDSFYASVEKRDNPDLRDLPVIVGGGRRGVVTTACYVARIRGVRSAMPMFKALQLCPDAIIVRPRFPAYVEASRAIRAMMEELTPVVEPLSLDEAFLDLGGTARVHRSSPAALLAGLARRIHAELGLTVSIGLSYNKFLAKVASDLDKPQGFSIIGQGDSEAFLAGKPVSLLWGVGPSARAALERAGIRTFDDLRRWDRRALAARFGSAGDRFWHLARGRDLRQVSADHPVKSLSNETTFSEDTDDPDLLDGHLWRLAEKVSDRAKARMLGGRIVTLKLKCSDFRLVTRRRTLRQPTQMADVIYRAARTLLDAEGRVGRLRLVGVGLSDLVPERDTDTSGDLLDPAAAARLRGERAADAVRARFGPEAIVKGRSLR